MTEPPSALQRLLQVLNWYELWRQLLGRLFQLECTQTAHYIPRPHFMAERPLEGFFVTKIELFSCREDIHEGWATVRAHPPSRGVRRPGYASVRGPKLSLEQPQLEGGR